MDAKKLRKMLTSGDSAQLHKALGEISGTLERLERDVAMLEAQGPPTVLPTSYRTVEKWHDDAGAPATGR
jgi:hypothetical protein